MRVAKHLAVVASLVGLIAACREQIAAATPAAKPPAREPRADTLKAAPTAEKPSTRDDEGARLVRERVVHLSGEITDDLATEVIAKLLFLESNDPKTPVTLEIDSPGGSVTAGLAIYDTMQELKCPVRTRCRTQAASMAAVLLAAGSTGAREAVPTCRVMLELPTVDDSTAPKGTSAEVRRSQTNRLRSKLEEILVRHSGQSLRRVREQLRAASWMDAASAKGFGLIDQIESTTAEPTDDGSTRTPLVAPLKR